MQRSSFFITGAIATGLWLSTACGGDAGGTGSVSVTVWGEQYIEEGIPQTDFVDGWSVRYEKFMITVGDVVMGKPGSARRALKGMTLFDLTQSGPFVVGQIARLEQGPWNEVSFSSLVVDEETLVSTTVTAADLGLMLDNGYNVYAAGTATRNGDEKRFSWGFSQPVTYADCVDVSGGQETSGVAVSDGADTTMQLTIHGDHLFYDDLAAPEAQLRFDVIAAADADADGEVTLQELDQVRLAELPAEQGSYGVGAADINDMGAFVTATTASLGHFNGEGHCRPEHP